MSISNQQRELESQLDSAINIVSGERVAPDLHIDTSSVDVSFSIDWIDMISMMIRDNMNKLDTCIVLQGGTGSGKSWTALTLAKSLQPNFSLQHDVCYKDDWQVYWGFLYDTTPFRAWLLDEGQWFLFVLDFSKRESKESIKQFMSRRYCFQYQIVATPTIKKMIDYLRDHRFRWNLIARYEEDGENLIRGFLDVYRRREFVKEGMRMAYWSYLGTIEGIEPLPEFVGVEYERRKHEVDIKLSSKAMARHLKVRKVA